MENPKRARSWKRRLRPRVNLKNDVPVLYSTFPRRRLACHSLGSCLRSVFPFDISRPAYFQSSRKKPVFFISSTKLLS